MGGDILIVQVWVTSFLDSGVSAWLNKHELRVRDSGWNKEKKCLLFHVALSL